MTEQRIYQHPWWKLILLGIIKAYIGLKIKLRLVDMKECRSCGYVQVGRPSRNNYCRKCGHAALGEVRKNRTVPREGGSE